MRGPEGRPHSTFRGIWWGFIMDEERESISRRELLKAAGLAGLGVAVSNVAEAQRAQHPSMLGVKFDRHDTVRLGIIGVGLRGTEVLREFLAVENVVVNAV